MRCVGVADAAPARLDAFVTNASQRGLQVVRGDGVAVAHLGAVHVTRADDGSFAVLDGEIFGATVDDLLAALRAGTAADVRFEGAVTWWDAARRTTTVLADPVGSTPLVLGRIGPSHIWSTEHRDLLVAGVAPVPDPHAVAMLAALASVPPPITYLRDAEALPPGRRATFRPGSAPTIETWFTHTAEPPGDESVGDALVAAVAARSKAAKLGAFLSAGIDSTAIVAVVRRVLDLPLETFSFRYEGGDDEATYAAETARLLGAGHTTITIGPEDLRARFDEVVDAFASPVTFGVHSFKQDAIREAGIGAVLTGADPGLWYDHGRSGVLASALWRLPTPALLAARRVPGPLHWHALLAAHGLKIEYLPLERRRRLVGAAATDGAATRYADALRGYARDVAGEAARHRATFVGARVRVNAAEWNTRWGRAFGHPIRSPFFDAQVCRAITRRRPWDAHEKTALRSYTASLLPPDRARTPKVFQELPIGAWLRGPLRDLVHDVLSPERVARAGIVDEGELRRLVAEHEAGVDRQWPLWQLMTAVTWAASLPAAADRGTSLVPRS